MRIVIPAAGAGLRCRPWSASAPKPLLPVANRPMLAHVLDELLPLAPERVVVITGWLGAQVEAWVREAYPRTPAAFARQEELLGQSHAALAAREHLAGEGLIVFPDMLFRLGADPLAGIGPDIDGAVFTAEPADRAGFAIADAGPDGLVRRIVEKPATPMAGDAVIGMYWVRDLARLAEAIDEQIARGLTAPNGEYALADAIGLLIEAGARVTTVPVREWIGAGSNASLLAANRWALDRGGHDAPGAGCFGSVVIPPCAIGAGATIERSVIGPYASIGAGATVRDSRVRDAIVAPGAVVEGADLAGTLVGWGA